MAEELIPLDEAEEEELIPLDQAEEEISPTVGMEAIPKEPRTMAGFGKAMARGAGDILAGGFSEEALAAAKSAMTGKPYSETRPGEREALAKAREQYPVGFGAGQAVGALGAAALAPESLVSKIGQVGTAALAGSVYGAGRAEEVEDVPEEMLSGGAEGVAGLFGGKLLGKALHAGRSAAKVGAGMVSGVSPKHVGRFMDRPGQVAEAAQLDEISNEIGTSLRSLQTKNIEAAALATDALPKDLQVPTDPFRDFIKNLKAQAFMKKDPEERAASGILDDYLSDEGMFPAGKSLTPQEIKMNMVSLGKILEGEFGNKSSLRDAYRKKIRFFMRDYLTKNFDDYEQAMIPVRHGMAVQEHAEKYFGNTAAIPSKLVSMANNPERYFDQIQALKKLDDLGSTQLAEENIDRAAKEAFDKASTAGSRKVATGATMGGAAASLMGVNPWVGAALGGAGGYAADIYGGKMARGIIEPYLMAKRGLGKVMGAGGGAVMAGELGAAANPTQYIKEPTAEAKEFTLPESLKNSPYMQMIEKAKAKGEHAVGSTHYLLMKNDPEYRKHYLGLDSK